MYLSPIDTSGRRGWVGSAELALRRTEIKKENERDERRSVLCKCAGAAC